MSKYLGLSEKSIIKNPIKNCFDLLAIGRIPNAKIFFFSIKYRSNQEMAIATNIPIIYLVGFKLCLLPKYRNTIADIPRKNRVIYATQKS